LTVSETLSLPEKPALTQLFANVPALTAVMRPTTKLLSAGFARSTIGSYEQWASGCLQEWSEVLA